MTYTQPPRQSGEYWLPIPDYPAYSVSNLGRIYSHPRVDALGRRIGDRILRPANNGGGYPFIGLWRDGVRKSHQVHRLVLTAFVGPCPDGMEGCHNDGNPMNSRLDNLRWDTRSGNHLDKRKHGTHPDANRMRCTLGHPLEEPNLKPHVGRRRCLACDRARSAAAHRGESVTKELADAYYAEISQPGTKFVQRSHSMSDRTACPYGHRLESPNLVLAGLRAGIRQCRACANGRKRARDRGVPFTPTIAAECYAKIMA